ncbi:alpha-1,2-Mannosidase [Mycena venus]|uniref:alpha-1,2-Mannosidase n=1 Tax=Mycena venus TaxID=2733690 RepID=A0A8H6YT09_9AGAR|nr:alpha-1,2-Mannosidase [Mycena venus]
MRTHAGLVLVSLAGAVRAGNIQLPGLTLPSSAASNAALVKSTFLTAYTDYKTFAWGHDDLEPISKSWTNGRRVNGWGATIFDSLSTLYIMDFTDLFAEAVEFASNVDFSYSHTVGDHVSFFETTIRYLGSMLSAYELNGYKDAALLANAQRLADKLIFGWVPANGPIPFVPYSSITLSSLFMRRIRYGSINFAINSADVSSASNNIASAGTNILEFYTLSRLTGNSTYQTFAERGMSAIASNPSPPFPGLSPQQVFASGAPDGNVISWDGGNDSYYEYLIKYFKMTANANTLWGKTWAAAVDSSIKQLLKKTSVATGQRTYLTSASGSSNSFSMGDLACFSGGNWIMGGKLLDNATIVNFGLNITDSCMNTYNTPTGIGGGGFAFVTADGKGTPPSSAAQQAEFNSFGFYNTDNSWYMRPESAVYAWRATGDLKYQTWAANVLQSIIKYGKAPAGFTSLNDVTRTDLSTDNLGDNVESFLYAEVFKYLFLMFDDPNHISFDTWVFNTECHPLAMGNGTQTATGTGVKPNPTGKIATGTAVSDPAAVTAAAEVPAPPGVVTGTAVEDPAATGK